MKVVLAILLLLAYIGLMLYNMYSFYNAYAARNMTKMIWYGVWVLFWGLAWKK